MRRMESFHRWLIVIGTLALLAVFLPTMVHAISVSPMAVFLDHRNRTGTVTLYNANPLPEEVDVSFAFGYPQSDSAGNVSVPLGEGDAPAGEPSAVGWLRAFPRRVVLQPGQQQVVRILAQPPEDLPDGEYWARVLVTATGGRPPVEEQVQPDVRVAITMRTIVVGSLNYRKGELTTGVTARRADAVREGETVTFTLDLEREGQAAYLGRVRVQLQDAQGRTLAEETDVVSVYRGLRRRFVLSAPVGTDLTGAHVRYDLATERPELGQENLIQAPPVEGVAPVR